jgi:N-ethylmaleimide reductase
MLDVLTALAEVCSPERVGVKLSPVSAHYGMGDSDPVSTFSYLLERLSRLEIGYVHMMEPFAADREAGPLAIEEVTRFARERFSGTIISNGGHNLASAQAALAEGLADHVSFGAAFIANPTCPRGSGLGLP